MKDLIIKFEDDSIVRVKIDNHSVTGNCTIIETKQDFEYEKDTQIALGQSLITGRSVNLLELKSELRSIDGVKLVELLDNATQDGVDDDADNLALITTTTTVEETTTTTTVAPTTTTTTAGV